MKYLPALPMTVMVMNMMPKTVNMVTMVRIQDAFSMAMSTTMMVMMEEKA